MRTITKPLEATPRELYHYEGASVGLGGRPTLYFTAAECAQIARAYYAAMTSDNGEPSKVADAWESLFNQWGSK